MLTQLQKFPAPYYGGKRHAAPVIWQALGDVAHYAEPFCGSCAVLLERPHPCNRTYHSETVNDQDGLLVNALRAIQLHPQETAEAASGYVCEADLHARHLALLQWVNTVPLEQLMGNPHWCNPEKAGWWLWGLNAWIGGGWCSGVGPWQVDPQTGRIVKAGQPGTWRMRPYISDDGRGVHHAGTREPGVISVQPRAVEALASWQTQVAADYAATDGFHPMTMPELRRWLHFLSARLRHVRILNGDWRRLMTTGALKILQVRQGQGVTGVFLDPPYLLGERSDGIYCHDAAATRDLAAECRAWCLTHGADPDYRIVLAGFAGEGHEVLEAQGWRCVPWFTEGYLRGGMGEQQHRERLWCSPGCLGAVKPSAQLVMQW